MKKVYFYIVISVLCGGFVISKSFTKKESKKLVNENYFEDIQEGDLIFQTSLSSQSQAIQYATKSIYSHCGIILKKDNKLFVLEAVQPVKYTILEEWIKRGKDKKFVIKRLKNANDILNDEITSKIKNYGNEFLGKDYDLTFEWSDEKIYCSELIWKIYKRSCDIEIGDLQKLKDFDLSHKEVQKILFKRYNVNIPLEEKVISPEAIFQSELLETIQSN